MGMGRGGFSWLWESLLGCGCGVIVGGGLYVFGLVG